MIEMHSHDMASRDTLRTVDPMTLFAVSGSETHHDKPIYPHTDLFLSFHEELRAHEVPWSHATLCRTSFRRRIPRTRSPCSPAAHAVGILGGQEFASIVMLA